MAKNDGVQPIQDQAGYDYARQVAEALTLATPGRAVPDWASELHDLAEQIGLALLGMNPPRQLDLHTRKVIAGQAMATAKWQRFESVLQRGFPEAMPPLGNFQEPEPAASPVETIFTLYPMLGYPDHYALGHPRGRGLVSGDRISIQVGPAIFIDATVARGSIKTDKGHYCTQQGESPGIYALTTEGDVLGLCTGMRVKLRE